MCSKYITWNCYEEYRVDTDGNVIQKPTSIIDYNHNMGGVDLVDQHLDSLDVLRKSYK